MVVAGSEGPYVKLLDFGLALARHHVAGKAGELSGTLSYMAPEVFEAQPISEAADVFSVGVLAYELFVRKHPFDRGDDCDLVAAILRSEPDWTPLREHPALVALLRRLLAKSPADRPSAEAALFALGAAAGLPVAPEAIALRESTLQAARFVGREAPLAALHTALNAARGGSGEVRLLAGESGVGKSRLLEELRAYALVQGVLCVRGQAVSEGGVAYGVWRDTLRTLCLGTELPELDASVLKSVLPDLEVLLERPIADAPALSPQAASLRLVHVIESLLLRQTEPLLLLLEDLHWADAESLSLLRRLAPACRQRPILIVASYRDDERPSLPQELPDCPVLKLARLSAAGITELCQSILGPAGCTAELVQFLEAETEGNIFFVIEVMRALAEEAGQLSLVGGERLPKNVLTGGIQAIVHRRLVRLPPEALPLLRLAAVAGRLLDLAVLRRCEPRLEPWLYLAAEAAVLEAVDQTWRFAHDKIRESLLLELGPAERQQLHLELARALESTYPGSPAHAAALAEHFQGGGELAKAAFYRVAAGVHALSQGATEAAASLLTAALAPQTRGLLPRAQAVRAYNGVVQANQALGRFLPCMEMFEQLMTELGYPPTRDLRLLLTAGGALLARQLRGVTAVPLLSEEDRQVASEAAHAMRWATETYVWAGRPYQSIAAALHGAELAGALADKGLQSYFLAVFAYFAGMAQLPAASRLLLDRGSRLLAAATSSRAELDFNRVAGAHYMNVAAWERVKQTIEPLLTVSRQVGDEHALTFGLSCRLVASFREDDAAVFEALGPELYEVSRRNHSGQFARTYPIYKAIRCLRAGDSETAHRLIIEAEGYLKASQDAMGQVLVGGNMALCQLRLGNEAGALRRAHQTLDVIESVRLSSDVFGEGISAVCEVYLDLCEAGSVTRQQELAAPLRRALAAIRRCGRLFPSVAPRALLWHGRQAWRHGAGRLARQLAAASERAAHRLGMTFDERLAQSWQQRFAQPEPAANLSLPAELSRLVQLLARGFA